MFASVFLCLSVQEALTTGPHSRRCPPRWSRPRPARSTSTSQPPPPPPTRPRTRRPGRADGRRPTPLTRRRRIRPSRHPAPTCPLLRLRRQPLTLTPTTPTTPNPTCRSRRLPLPSVPQQPSRRPTARNVRSSNAGMRRRKLGWRKRGGVSFIFIFYFFYYYVLLNVSMLHTKEHLI